MLCEGSDFERTPRNISIVRAVGRFYRNCLLVRNGSNVNKFSFTIFFGALMLFFLTTLGGCSFAGLVAGSIIDGNKKDEWIKKGNWQLGNLKPGTPVRVQLRQGDTLTASYLGLGRVSMDEYVQAYAKICSTQVEGLTLPSLYDSVRVSNRRYANDTKGEFAGFDYQRVSVKNQNGTEDLRILPSSGSVITFKHSDTLDSRMFNNLIASGAVPLLSTLRVGETNVFRIDQVSELRVYGKTTITKKFVIIGAVIDTAILTFLIAAAASMSDESFGW